MLHSHSLTSGGFDSLLTGIRKHGPPLKNKSIMHSHITQYYMSRREFMTISRPWGASSNHDSLDLCFTHAVRCVMLGYEVLENETVYEDDSHICDVCSNNVTIERLRQISDG